MTQPRHDSPGTAAGHNLLATSAAVLIGVQVGIQLTITRSLADDIAPGTLAFFRYSIAFLILLPFAIPAYRVPFRPGDLFPIAGLGVAMFGIMIGLQNFSLHFTPSGRGALIFSTMPFFTMIFAAWFGGDPLTRWKVAGVALTISGVAIVLGADIFAPSPAGSSWLGDGLMVTCAMIAGLCSVLFRPYVRRYTALPVSVLAVFCAIFPLWVISALEGGIVAIPTYAATTWISVAVLGVMSAIFYWLWLWCLGRISATLVNVFQALGPITAAGAAAYFLGEAITASFIVGVAVVTAGFLVAHRR
jgi:drug/metabolite transporter (DMT)-like permease